MNIQEKLLSVQTKLKAPKGQYNEFGKYNYRSCEDIQEAVKPLCDEIKAVLTIGDELVQIGDRFYIKSTARFMDCESEMELSNTAFAREEFEKKGMDSSQITGSASSYARKYALNGLFCIDDVKDADTQDNTSKNTGSGKKNGGNLTRQNATTHQTSLPTLSEVQIAALHRELKRTGKSETGLCKKHSVEKIADMTVKQYKETIDALKSMNDAKPDPATIPPNDAAKGPWR